MDTKKKGPKGIVGTTKKKTKSILDTIKKRTNSIVEAANKRTSIIVEDANKRTKNILETAKKKTSNATKSSIGTVSQVSSNSVSQKSKSSNRSKASSRKSQARKRSSLKSKGKLSISSRRKSKGVPVQVEKPKRNFNFQRNAKTSLPVDDKQKNRKGSRRISKGSTKNKGSFAKGDIGNKGKGIQEENKKEDDIQRVSTAEGQTHPLTEEVTKSNQVHYQLRYNEWTYFDFVPENSRVLDLKLRIYMYTRVQPYKQKLYLMRKKMRTSKRIDEYGMIPEWYDNKRPAMLFLKFRDKCLEKIPPVVEITPEQLAVDEPEEKEGPELVAPPTTPVDTNSKPTVGQKKGKSAKAAKEQAKAEGQGEVKGKGKETLKSVSSKQGKVPEQVAETSATINSEIAVSEQGSGGRKLSKAIEPKKRGKSIGLAESEQGSSGGEKPPKTNEPKKRGRNSVTAAAASDLGSGGKKPSNTNESKKRSKSLVPADSEQGSGGEKSSKKIESKLKSGAQSGEVSVDGKPS